MGSGGGSSGDSSASDNSTKIDGNGTTTTDQICPVATCKCSNGEVATGAECIYNNAETCLSCDEGYYRNIQLPGVGSCQPCEKGSFQPQNFSTATSCTKWKPCTVVEAQEQKKEEDAQKEENNSGSSESGTGDGRRGLQGPRGFDGPRGFRGLKGEGGGIGPIGFNGTSITGERGEKGEKGEKGDDGIDGSIGARGFKGVNGTGEQGEKGEKGDDGLDGTNGGEKGKAGDQGLKGLDGEQGLQGIKGIQGDQGSQGTNGKNGQNGTDGNQGIKGIQGDQGTNGKNGKNGMDGNAGQDGVGQSSTEKSGNNGDKNTTKEYVVKHSVTLSGIDTDTFNTNTKLLDSFTETVMLLLDVSTQHIRNVRAVATKKAGANVRRFLSGSGAACTVLYELVFDSKTQADAIEKKIEQPDGLFQNNVIFMSAFKSKMKRKKVDLTVASSITTATPALTASINGAKDTDNAGASNDAADEASTSTNEVGTAFGLDLMFVLSVLAVVLASIAILVAVVACKRGKRTQESATSGRLLLDENIELDIFDSTSVPTAAAAAKRTARPTSKKGKQSQKETKEQQEKQSTRNQDIFGSRGSFTVDNPANSQIEMATLNSIAVGLSSASPQGKWKQNELNTPSTTPTHHSRTSTELPDGWAKHTTGAGRKYYGNTTTQESTWAPPPGSTGGSSSK